MRNFIKKERLFLSVFGLGVIIFLWDVILLNKIFLHGDYKQQFFPWFMEYAKAVKHFTLPYWTPNMACGFPLVAEGQIGAFYPLNMIVFFMLPPVMAYSWGIVLHFMLGGIFMYLFCKKIGLKDIAAVMPAILFMFASPYAGCFSNIASLKVLCWFPLVLYLICLSLENNKPYILALSGIVMGIQLLAGAPQMAFYSIAFSSLYFLFLIITVKDVSRINYLTAFMASFVIALMVCSPQLIETRTLVELSNRSTRDISFAIARSFFPLGILTLVFPSTMSMFDGVIYIGILPLVFSLFTIFYVRKGKHAHFFIFLFVISLLCAFGRYDPFYTAFLKLTKFYMFRIPSKFLFFSAFSLIVLSGFGLQDILKNMDEEKRKHITIISSAIVVLPTLFLFLAGIFFKTWKSPIISFAKEYVIRHVYNPNLHRYPAQYYMDRVDSLYQNALNVLSFSGKEVFIQLFVLVVSVSLIILYSKKMVVKDAFKRLFVGVIFIDLIFFSFIGPGFRGNLMKYGDAVKNTAETILLGEDRSLYRVYQFQIDEDGNMLQPNMNIYFGIDNVGAYSPLIFRKYIDLLGPLGCVDDSTGYSQVSEDELRSSLKLLGMLNVKYIISKKAINDVDLEFFKDTNTGRKIFLNKKRLPRAFIVHKIKVIKDDIAILNYLRDKNFDPGETAVVEEWPHEALSVSGGGDSQSVVNIERYAELSVSIRTKSRTEGLLILSDYCYPGWKGYLDDKPVDILRVNYILRGIYLPKGEHKVRFQYKI